MVEETREDRARAVDVKRYRAGGSTCSGGPEGEWVAELHRRGHARPARRARKLVLKALEQASGLRLYALSSPSGPASWVD